MITSVAHDKEMKYTNNSSCILGCISYDDFTYHCSQAFTRILLTCLEFRFFFHESNENLDKHGDVSMMVGIASRNEESNVRVLFVMHIGFLEEYEYISFPSCG